MIRDLLSILITTAAALLACTGLYWWFSADPGIEFTRRIPASARPAPLDRPRPVDPKRVNIRGTFTAGSAEVSDIPGSWPCFRGTTRDNVYRGTTRIPERLPPNGPEVLWQVELGDGYAGAAIHNGAVYILDYDEKKEADTLRKLSLETGQEIWNRGYPVKVKRNHGKSRTVPAVTDHFAVTMGPRCHVMCVRAESGDFLWGMDLVRKFKAEVPPWYTGQCPLIVNNTAILAPGGSALLMGVDCATGKILWKTPNPDQWKMSHACVTPFTVNDKKMFVYTAIGGTVGVSAEKKDAGKVLWKTTAWNHAVIAPSPVLLDDGRLFLTAGYGAGSIMLQVIEENGIFTAKELYSLSRKEFACEQHTPILYKGLLYSILPKDAGRYREQLVCMDPATQEIKWRSGRQKRFGLGPFMIADQKILTLNDSGVLTVCRTGSNAYEELASVTVLNGHEAWAPMALAGGKLLLRDEKTMKCLNIGIEETPHENTD